MKVEDVSFSHAFGIEEQYEKYCTDITYDNEEYTKDEQELIQKYIDENRRILEIDFCEKYKF